MLTGFQKQEKIKCTKKKENLCSISKLVNTEYLPPMKFFTLSIAILFLGITTLNSQSFWSEDFADGFPSNWENDDLSGQSVDWEFETEPNIVQGLSKFNSTSVKNGFMIVRGKLVSDLHQSTLTTPTIDCSQKNEVHLSFENFVVTNSVSAALGLRVLVKNESEDWQEFVVMPEQNRNDQRQESPNPYRSFIDISAKAAGKSNVQIRWQWQGIVEEFWAMDDVQLFDFEPYYERVIWGNNPGQGDFEGSINGWHEVSISVPDPATDTWTWEKFGSVDNSLAANSFGKEKDYPYLDSHSNHNGAMVFNADFFTTGDTLGVPPPYPHYHAELISPIINLENVENEVNVRFEQMIMKAGTKSLQFPSTTSFTFSTDGGRTWEEPIGLNNRVPDNTLVSNIQNISICGASKNSNVRLKFIFDGDLYFWVIDDVVVIEKDDNDLRIVDDFYAIAPNLNTPASQVENIGFLADIENFGENTQTNVELFVEILEKNSGQSVFKDKIDFGELENCSIVENVFFENTFLPPATPAEYEMIYYITSDSIDSRPENDAERSIFAISDSTYAKENGATATIEPIKGNNFEYGNVFFTPRGKDMIASSVTFGINKTANLQNADLSIFLYRSFADEDEDGFFDESERQIVGFGSYKIRGDETVVSDGIITQAITDFNGDPVELEDNVFYTATVRYIDDDNRPCQMLAGQEQNYLAMWFRHDSIGSSRYAGVELASGNKFDLESLNFDLVPMIRLNIKNKTTSVAELNQDPFFLIYPNPTTDFFVLKNEFAGLSSIELLDAKGVLVKNWIFREGNEYDISNVPTGIYFLKFRTEKGWFERKLIKK